MATTAEAMADIAEKVRDALASADLSAYAELLDPRVTWGPPDNPQSGCHSRDQVLAWYRRAFEDGVRSRINEVTVHEDHILIGMMVSGRNEDEAVGGEIERWQVLTVRDGKVVEIVGFESRREAAERAQMVQPTV